MTSSPPPQAYVTDVAYVRTFSSDMSPAMLRLVAALNGFPMPDAEDFDYCELGSGNGDTLATMAAAYPRARFVGVDFNPAHVAFANDLASRGGLSNLRFLERDFEDLHREALPDFDYLCMHGVFSWIGPEKRKAILDFALARLKPGGLLYVTYNALPGWAAIEPLRRLMLDHAGKGDSLERVRAGVSFAKQLCEAGAVYFASNPAARAMLETMLSAGLPYVAHEYFQAHWHPMYFADVAREMAANDLHFIGQLPLYLNYRNLAIPAPLASQFIEVEDRLELESLKDFAVNEFFRRDVYVKGKTARSERAIPRYFEETAFGTLRGGDPIAREARLPHHTLRFNGPLFDALVPALSERSATVSKLARLPEMAAFGAQAIRDAVVELAIGGQLWPMQRANEAFDVQADARYRVGSAYNRMVLGQRLSSASPTVLASSVAGTGLSIPMLEAVCLRVLTEVSVAERPAWVRAFVARQPLRLRIGDRPVTDSEEQAKILLAELAQFCAKRLPKLVALGILEEHSSA